MAHVHTPLPEHAGELGLARQLSAIDDPHLHLWFSLNWIPRVRDIDIIVWHEEAGVFVVEVKAVPLKMFKSFGWARCEIEGRGDDKSPQLQAVQARDSLLDFLPREVRRHVFLTATACLPKISRSEWDGHWDDEKVTGEFAKSLLFREDCYGGPDALRERLEHIWFNPPAKGGSDRRFTHDRGTLESFDGAVSAEARPKPAPSDEERLRVIESRVSSETEREVPVGSSDRVVYRGYPGTGKTFRLLEIGMRHALAGRRVLFACFNKVLAADVARLLFFSKRLDSSRHRFDTHDVFELLGLDAKAIDVSIDGDDPDAWGEQVVEELEDVPEVLDKYDLVLIDEAQDMRAWALRLLELHANPGAAVCIASGTGQELYSQPSEWLQEFTKTATTKQLRRNFRNTLPVFRLAHLFYETAFDAARIPDAMARFKPGSSATQLPMFERREGMLPMFRELDDLHLPWDDSSSPWFADAQFEHMAAQYQEILTEQLDELEESDRPIDVLVLVPAYQSMERAWMVEALTRAGVPFTDYTVNANRRSIAHTDAVRLCTYHSARGLEGQRVVLLGVEGIDSLAAGTRTPVRHLGYIVLSRSVFECVMVRRASGSRTTPVRFIAHAMDSLRKADS